jgi:hypothetical protein
MPLPFDGDELTGIEPIGSGFCPWQMVVSLPILLAVIAGWTMILTGALKSIIADGRE